MQDQQVNLNQQVTNHVITSNQINQIISVLDQVVKHEGISLQSASFILEHIVRPLTALPQIEINEPQQEDKEPVNE